MLQSQNNICYNERQNIWTTRYDWNPVISENINDKFFSIGGINHHENKEGNVETIWSHDVAKTKPTIWYGAQHPFEFEFVVAEPTGVHKIIENLQIISNNVQPEQLTFEIIGDAYQFNKERLLHTGRGDDDFESRIQSNLLNKDEYNRPSQEDLKPQSENEDSEKIDLSSKFRNTSKVKKFKDTSWENRETQTQKPYMDKDRSTKQYHMHIPQECRNMETYGRRLGNIQYKEDSWYTTVEPLIYDARIDDPSASLEGETKTWKSTRIRDKWVKIRVRYTGEDLAIITAIKSVINI